MGHIRDNGLKQQLVGNAAQVGNEDRRCRASSVERYVVVISPQAYSSFFALSQSFSWEELKIIKDCRAAAATIRDLLF